MLYFRNMILYRNETAVYQLWEISKLKTFSGIPGITTIYLTVTYIIGIVQVQNSSHTVERKQIITGYLNLQYALTVR